MKVSIITVVYDGERTIEETILSVASQSFPSVEHIIIDGASTDRTIEIVKSHKDKIECFISESDNGLYDAMNKGLNITTGEIIGFLNADDVYTDKSVLRRVASVFSDTTVDACYGDLVYVAQNDLNKIVRFWKSSDHKKGMFKKGWCPPHPTFFVRKKIYEQFGGFDLGYKIAADFELMIRFLEACEVNACYLPEVLVKMRMGGTTNRSLKNIVKQNYEILKALRSYNLKPSLFSYAASKLISRGGQFLSRPS